jgi:uncharacterized membrane protein HdeD (DUF308 family)
MATSYIDVLGHDLEQERKTAEYIHRHRTWFVFLGTALIVLGVVAAAYSLASTYASMLFLAMILLLGGIMRLIAALSAREWTGSLLLALSGALYLVTGILTWRHPIAAALALTLLFSALLLGMGSFRLIASVWYRFPHWGWVALSGLISILAVRRSLVHRILRRSRSHRGRDGMDHLVVAWQRAPGGAGEQHLTNIATLLRAASVATVLPQPARSWPWPAHPSWSPPS